MKLKALFLFLAVLFFPSCKSDSVDEINSPDGGRDIYLSIQAPNGGESILEGDRFTIKWNTNCTSQVDIKFTTDNGAVWKMIKGKAENSGIFEWLPVPQNPSDFCRIKISSSDGTLSDESDNNFSIISTQGETITLISPTGGEKWPSGSSQTIKWISSGIESVKIEYSTDGGITWKHIRTVGNRSNSCIWNPVDAAPALNVLIRVSDSADGIPKVQCPSSFSITPEEKIRIISPSPGTIWYAGFDGAIKWESENVADVSISYSPDGGNNWHSIASSVPSNGIYYWNNIPQINSYNCIMKISGSRDGYPTAISEGLFAILRNPSKFIQVISPGDRDEFCAGDTIKIRWNSANVNGYNIKITTDGGSSWNEIASGLRYSTTYNYIAHDAVSILCKVRVTDWQDPQAAGESRGLFALKGERKISLLYPGEGAVLTAGDSTAITWSFSNIKYVNVDYSYETVQNARNWIRLATKLERVSSIVTSFNVISDNYKVRVSDWEKGLVYSENRGTFRVISR